MKTKMLFLFLSIILLTTEFLMAQPPGLPVAPNAAPIDGGVSLLAVAGGFYALKKLRDRKKKY